MYRHLITFCGLALLICQSTSNIGAQQPAQQIFDIDWNYDGSLLATGDSNGRTEVREASSNQIIFTYEGEFLDVDNVEWSPHENLLAIGSYAIVIVNVSTGETVAQIPMDSGFDLEWSPDGKYLASASGDGSGHYFVNVWDVQMETLMRYDWYKATDISWSPDSQMIAIASDELSDNTDYGPFAILDIATGVITTPFDDETVNSRIAWSPNGNRIATTGFSDGCWCDLTMWDVASGQHVWSVDVGEEVFDTVWSIDSQWLATTSYDGILFWDAATGQPSTDQSTIGIFANRFALNPDGIRLAYISYDNNQPTIAFATLAAPQPADSRTPLDTPPNTITSIDWSPDGLLLATANNSGAIQIRDAASGTIVHDLITAQPNPILTVAWNPAGTAIAATVNENIYIWERDTWQVLHILQGHVEPVWSVAWSPDGTKLASVTNTGSTNLNFFIWNASTGQQIQTMEYPGRFYKIDWSPDNTSLATTGGNRVHLWNISQTTIQSFLQSYGEVVDAKWSPDGSNLAVVGGSGAVSIWDVGSQQVIQEIEGHIVGIAGMVFAVAWSPDGSKVASAATDGTVKVWDPTTGQSLHVINIGSEVYSVTWSPDGESLAYGGEASLLDVAPAEPSTAFIAERVWHDANKDVLQPGEEINGIASITLNLLDTSDTVIQMTTSANKLGLAVDSYVF